MKYKLFKFKKGKRQQWKDWCVFLNAHKEEVLETLREEQVTQEVGYASENYFLYGMEGLCLPSTDTKLNREHKRNLKECLEPVADQHDYQFEVWFDFVVG